ncbi:uncharacterized protein LOC118420190 [Branchiostoma floridae]|uniref:Uncharacterized protein LOC118420190 n=1 Tax=Branchiostoma floridae TaxID=7739 RepID=A0A9J7LHD7_BRAFL|nr:uncharacterized protein LOC118420190 [Branchiostoma floridae]
MSAKYEPAVRSGQAKDCTHAKDNIQPNTSTYTAIRTRSEDIKAKAPLQNTNAVSDITEDMPVDSAERDTHKNSAECPALPGDGSTMRECPHPPGAIHPNEAYEHMDPMKNLEYEHMYDMIPDAMSTRNASTSLYGRTTDESIGSDQRPASMEPYAVRRQEDDSDDDNVISQEIVASAPNSVAKTNTDEENIEPYAVRHQEENDDDDNVMSQERGASAGNMNAKTITTEDNIEQYAVKHQDEDVEDEKGAKAGNIIIDTEENIEAYAVAYMCENVIYSGQKELQTKVPLKNSEDFKTTLNDDGFSNYGNDAARSANGAGSSGNDADSSGNDIGTSKKYAGSSGNDTGTKKDTGISENDAGTSDYLRNDGNISSTHEPQRTLHSRQNKLIPNPMYIPNGPQQAAGGM